MKKVDIDSGGKPSAYRRSRLSGGPERRREGYSDYDAVCKKLPEAMQRPPSAAHDDLKSFQAYRGWRERTEGIWIPEAELRNQFAENPDGRVGDYKTPGNIPAAIMEGDDKHDYSQIRAAVLALVGYPESPQEQIRKSDVQIQPTGSPSKRSLEPTWA